MSSPPPRRISDWMEIFTDECNARDTTKAARFVIKELTRYSNGHAYNEDDVEQIANALAAWSATVCAAIENGEK